MPKERAPGAYVRVATLDDLPALSGVAARAFENDPLLCWLASREKPMMNEPAVQQTKHRHYLQLVETAVLRSVFMEGGRVTVVAIPDDKGGEIIAAYTLWLPPGCSTGTFQGTHVQICPLMRHSAESFVTTIRAGYLRAVPGWGLRGLYVSRLS